MAVFEYKATDADGRSVNGLLMGASADTVHRELREKGLTVESLRVATGADFEEPASAPAPPPRVEAPASAPALSPRTWVVRQVLGPLFGEVHVKHQMFFFGQLATMLDAGVNPVQALGTLADSTRSAKLARVLRELRAHALEGRPFSAGMQRYPEVFSPLVMSMVRAGEEGGFLSTASRHIAEYKEAENELRNLLRRETFWPKLTLVMSVLIIVAANMILAEVAPEGTRLWSPLTTPSTWVWLGPLIVILFLIVKLVPHQAGLRRAYHEVLLVIPWLGGAVRAFAMARFSRAMAALYKGAVPMRRAMQLAADAAGNEVIRARIYQALPALEEGGGIVAMMRESRAFNRIVLDMAATGEMTGNLDAMLVKVSEYYEDEGRTSAKQMGMVFGVVVFIAVAIYVAMIVINFYSGYFGNLFKNA